MDTTSIRLPRELLIALDRAAEARGATRSTVCREALESYLVASRPAKARSFVARIDALVQYEGSGVGDLAERGAAILRERFGARRRRPR